MVGVENTCNLLTTDGAFVDLKGSVVYSDPNPADAYASSKFTVTFNFQGQMVSGSYWVVGLDSQYRYAVVSDESGQTLYILSRNPTLPAALYDQALQEAKQQNLDISKLTLTEQNGCNYP
jgi:apolipoprotein D and lipocalin family protein